MDPAATNPQPLTERQKANLRMKREHLEWCKFNALEILAEHPRPGALRDALTKMFNDVMANQETKCFHVKNLTGIALLKKGKLSTPAAVRNFIESYE